MVINHLLTGMILQVLAKSLSLKKQRPAAWGNKFRLQLRYVSWGVPRENWTQKKGWNGETYVSHEKTLVVEGIYGIILPSYIGVIINHPINQPV